MSGPSVGQEILSFCGKCSMNLWHTVVAKVGEQVKKVQCKTCKGIHAFKAPTDERIGVRVESYNPSGKPTAKEGTSSIKEPRKTKKSQEAIARVDKLWEQLMTTNKDKKSAPYEITRIFIPNALISHPKFGDGIVIKQLGPQKIEVVFRDGLKVLAQNLS